MYIVMKYGSAIEPSLGKVAKVFRTEARACTYVNNMSFLLWRHYCIVPYTTVTGG